MRIELSKTSVEFTPEADYEKTMLEGLWRMLVDCTRFNQKLVPVGLIIVSENRYYLPYCPFLQHLRFFIADKPTLQASACFFMGDFR